MLKKIAVLVRDRQSEALRMSLGLTLVDDIVDVYMPGGRLAGTEQDRLNEEVEYLSDEEIAHKLLDYDHVLPY